MIDPHDVNAKADAVKELLRRKLGLRGATLSRKLARAGRLLPGRMQKAGQVIVTAQKNAAHPKLAMMADSALVEAAYAELSRYLKEIDPAEQRKTRLLGWLGALVFNLMTLTVLLVILLRWQGFL